MNEARPDPERIKEWLRLHLTAGVGADVLSLRSLEKKDRLEIYTA